MRDEHNLETLYKMTEYKDFTASRTTILGMESSNERKHTILDLETPFSI